MSRVIDDGFVNPPGRVVPVDGEAPEPVVYARKLPRNLLDSDAIKVIRRLNQHGFTAYLVGGGVRDLLLGRRPKDFDLATDARPNEVRDLFRNCRVIGRRFRLAHILFGRGKIIETATFRRDPAQRYELAEPKYARGYDVCQGVNPARLIPSTSTALYTDTADLLITSDNNFGEPHEDALRRDFTMNGLFYDLARGEIIDYVGGVADLEDGVVRMIGVPSVRFREDPVRALRAIKFSARLDMGMDPEIYDAIVQYRGELARCPAARVLEEIFRLMRGGAAHRSIYLAWDTGVLSHMLPEIASFLDDAADGSDLTWGRLQAIDELATEHQLPSDAVMMSALLLGPIDEAIEGHKDPLRAYDEFVQELSLRLGMSRRLKDRMRLLTLTQRKLRRGKIGSLHRREYFAESAQLFALDCRARGEEVPSWAIDPAEASYHADDDEPRPRRRRRRKR